MPAGCAIQPGAVDLVGADHVRIEAVSAPIGLGPGFQIVSFVVGVQTQSITKGEFVAGCRD
jgi:hypothetical protein